MLNVLSFSPTRKFGSSATPYTAPPLPGAHMGTFVPDPHRAPCMTYPITDAILPADVSELIDDRAIGDVRVARIKLKNGKQCGIVCLPKSVVWISPEPLRAIGIENDRMSGGARSLAFASGSEKVIG